MKNNQNEQDMVLTCQKCRSRFYFTVGEQHFYKQNGLNIPKYCKKCREQKKRIESDRQIPRACSTCYFCVYRNHHVENGRDYYGVYVCTRCEHYIINDRPCEHWTKYI